jgi:hypothetical protein
MKYFIVLGFLFSISKPAICQTTRLGKPHSITGRLTSENGEIKTSMLVLLSDMNNHVQRSQLTDSVGRFNFTDVLSGEYYIGTSGKKNDVIRLKDITLKDTTAELNVGDMLLPNDIRQLKEVIVTSTRPYIQRKLDKLIVNVDANSLLAGNSLNDLLPKLPGVSLNESNQLVVNGKSNVLVLIDGKGQFVSQEQLNIMLANMKAESIDKVEIISNPSVKYDANGGAVINIVTKKNSMTSDVHQTIGQQIRPVSHLAGHNEPYYSLGTNLNYLIGNMRTFASADYTYSKEFQQNQGLLQYDTPVLGRNSLSSTNSIASRLNTRFGFNADLDKTTSLDGTFTFYIPFYRYFERNGNQAFTSTTPQPDSTVSSNSRERNYHNRNTTINLRLSKRMNESRNEAIDFYFDFNDFNYLTSSQQDNIYFILNNNNKNELYSSDHEYAVRIYSFKTDYSIQAGKKSKFEAGGKFSLIHNRDTYDYGFNTDAVNLNDSTLFKYREIVSAAYLNFSGSTSFIDYQFGARIENTASNGDAPLIGERLNRNYTNLFPAFTIQHNFKSKASQQLALSYNKRIVRPGYSDFNPNNNLITRFSSTTGSPALNPQFINNFELSYNLASLNVTLYDAYQKNIKDLITQASDQVLVAQNKIVAYSSSNDVGLNISYPYSFNKWLSTYSSFSGGHSSSKLLDNSTLNYYSYYFSESLTFAINSRNTLDVRYFFMPETQFNYGRMLQVDNLSAGYRTQLIPKKLYLTLNINDILGHNKLSTIQDFGNVQTESISLRNNRTYMLTLRYNFPSGKMFSLRNKATKNDKSEIRLN